MKGFFIDIEKATKENKNFRQVLYTSKHSQLVLMSLLPGEEIGEEIHPDVDQFFRIESGEGKCIIDGNEYEIKDGTAIIVPQGAKHNVINTGNTELKLYTIYSPPEHKDKVIHPTKEIALADKEDYFDGVTSE